ncbi:MAG: hypothetical protein IPM92_06150 [Saprospiraceae bacterium]|nr:hypothetical protein [Saprospiraceae bacterium]
MPKYLLHNQIKIVHIIYLILGFEYSFSQSPLSHFLQTEHFRNTDSLFNSFQQQTMKMDFRKPIFKQLDFRTESHDFKLNQQEYLLRLSFQNNSENKYSSQIYSTKKEILEKEYSKWKAKLLLDKYYSLLEGYKSLECLAAYKSALQQYEIMYKTYMIRLQENTQLLKPLAKIEIKIATYENDLIKLESDYQHSKKLLHFDDHFILLNPIVLQTSDIIEFVENDKTALSYDDTIYILQQDIEQLQYKIKKSAGNQILDFIQAKYTADPESLLQEKASIGIGLKIPYIIRNNYLNEDYDFNKLKIQWSAELNRQEYVQEVWKLKVELVNKCKQQLGLEERISKLEAKYNLAKLMETSILDPEDIVDIRLEINMLNIHQIKSKFEILHEYIQYLHKSGHFLINPDLNYLTLPFRKL